MNSQSFLQCIVFLLVVVVLLVALLEPALQKLRNPWLGKAYVQMGTYGLLLNLLITGLGLSVYTYVWLQPLMIHAPLPLVDGQIVWAIGTFSGKLAVAWMYDIPVSSSLNLNALDIPNGITFNTTVSSLHEETLCTVPNRIICPITWAPRLALFKPMRFSPLLYEGALSPALDVGGYVVDGPATHSIAELAALEL